jgi:hypothetical protein
MEVHWCAVQHATLKLLPGTGHIVNQYGTGGWHALVQVGVFDARNLKHHAQHNNTCMYPSHVCHSALNALEIG